MSKPAYVYILSDSERQLKADVTKDLDVALYDAEEESPGRFVVLVEEFSKITSALDRLASLLHKTNSELEEVVSANNPEWKRLYSHKRFNAGSPQGDDPGSDSGGGVGARVPRSPDRPRVAADAKSPPSPTVPDL